MRIRYNNQLGRQWVVAGAAQNLTIPLCFPVLAPPSTVRPDAVHPYPDYGNWCTSRRHLKQAYKRVG